MRRINSDEQSAQRWCPSQLATATGTATTCGGIRGRGSCQVVQIFISLINRDEGIMNIVTKEAGMVRQLAP